MTCVTGNDDSGVGTQSQVNFTTTLGTTYYIVVGGYLANEGNYELSVSKVLEDASFSYSAVNYCVDASDPGPTITGAAGGSFSSTAGLFLNATTGIIDLSASNPGTYSITYTTNGTCPNSSSVSFTINDLDDASFSYSSATYCVDASDPTPTITGLTGGSFSSTAGLSLNATTGIIDLSASTSGAYSITYTTNGTCTNSSDFIISINSIDIDLGMDITNCDSYTIDGTTTGAVSYLWSTGETTSSINIDTTGLYTLTVTDVNGCTGTDDIQVTINTLNLNLTVLNNTIDGSTPNAASYLWSTGETSPTIQVEEPGIYILTVIDNNGCTNSVDVEITSSAVSINDHLKKTDIKLFPNPTSGEFILEIPELKGQGQVHIYNINSQLIKVQSLSETESVFNMNEFANGIYFLKIEINGRINVKELIINK